MRVLDQELPCPGPVDVVVAIGVDRRVAIDPVAARYPGTRFVEAQPDARAIARAIG